MQRILIIGGNGCGKTTFSYELAKKLDLPLIHLDALYWKDGWQCASNEEFDAALMRELKKPEWIIDGNISRTLPLRLKYCDAVIYMDFPRAVCAWGAIKRVAINHNQTRSDMGGNCPEKFDRKFFAFLKSVWNFNKNNRQRYRDMLSAAEGVRIVTLKSRRQARRFLCHL